MNILKVFSRVLIGCAFAGSLAVVSLSQSPGSCKQPLNNVREYTRYEATLGTWVMLVAPKKPTDACLIDFATHFHKLHPDQNFEMFDSVSYELEQYITWASNGMQDRHPFPEKWLRKHQIATLQPLSDSVPCGHWVLRDGNDRQLQQFDRVKCAWEK